jgi:hypothetical protein
MTESLNIYQAMAKILADIDFIGKDRKADMGNAGRYNFRGIDDIYNALHSSFAKHKVFIIPKIIDSKIELQEKEKTYNGVTNKSYNYSATLKVEFTFCSEDGSSISAVGIGHALDNSDKATNKAQSSALKYCLMQTFLIPTEESKDVESENIQVQVVPKSKSYKRIEEIIHLPDVEPTNYLPDPIGDARTAVLEWTKKQQYEWAQTITRKPSKEWGLREWELARANLQESIDRQGLTQNLIEAGADY